MVINEQPHFSKEPGIQCPTLPLLDEVVPAVDKIVKKEEPNITIGRSEAKYSKCKNTIIIEEEECLHY